MFENKEISTFLYWEPPQFLQSLLLNSKLNGKSYKCIEKFLNVLPPNSSLLTSQHILTNALGTRLCLGVCTRCALLMLFCCFYSNLNSKYIVLFAAFKVQVKLCIKTEPSVQFFTTIVSMCYVWNFAKKYPRCAKKSSRTFFKYVVQHFALSRHFCS